jgi:CheY-like chemotaxis protein
MQEDAPAEADVTGALPETFVDEVRCALAHLYDYAYLQNLPLAHRLAGSAATDGVTRAQRLRRLLLDCLEQLRPEQVAAGEETRSYAILTYRSLDGLSVPEIADKLALSRRQAYREYARGVEAVASLIWEQANRAPYLALKPPPAGAAHDGTRLGAAQVEVERLSGNMTIEPLPLPEVVAQVTALLAPRIAQIRARVEVMVPPVSVLADRTLLRQALLSFLSYALDSAGERGTVTVAATQQLHQVLIELDTCTHGTQAVATRRQGVGVAVAQKLIEAMGGHANLAPASESWHCTLLLPTRERNTVLVIDDNVELAALFQRYMAGHNLALVSAGNAEQAIALAAELQPQLIMLDLMLPHVDGWEILQQLRALPGLNETPIVICSVLNEPEVALAMGANDYVTKPLNQATLVDVLQRWLGRLHPAV